MESSLTSSVPLAGHGAIAAPLTRNGWRWIVDAIAETGAATSFILMSY